MEKPLSTVYDRVPSTSDSDSTTLLHEAEVDDTLDNRHDWTRKPSRRPFVGIWAIAVIAVLLLVVNVTILSLQIKRQPAVKNDLPYYLTNSAGQVYPSKVSRTYWDFDDNFLDHNISNAQIFWKGLFPGALRLWHVNSKRHKSNEIFRG